MTTLNLTSNDLDAAEGRAASDERAAAAVLAGLAQQRDAVVRRMEELRGEAAHARLTGVRHDDVLELQRRLAATIVPEADVGDHAWRANEARRAAIAARKDATHAALAAAEHLTRALALLNRALDADEALVRSVHEEARAAAVQQTVVPARPPPPSADSSDSVLGRRRTQRVPLRTAVDLSTDTNFFTGFTGDISAGGLFVATFSPLSPGDAVALELTLPNGQHLALQGEVRWTREFDERAPDTMPGAGVEFRDLTPEALASIRAFVAHREPMFFPD